MMGWFSDLFRDKTRESALRLKIGIREVERQLPVFDKVSRFEKLISGRCVRYSLPRISRNSKWELLQRDKKQGAQLPNGYLLKSSNTDQEFTKKFRPIAEEFPEEYFEFEGTSMEVAVFWAEWGGAQQAERIHRVLLLMQNL